MADSVLYILEQRAKKDAAIRRAVEAYPDARIDGDHLVSNGLRHEDCDTIVTIDGYKGATSLRAGKHFGDVVLLRDWPHTVDTTVFLRNLTIHDRDLYGRILAALAGRR